MAVMDNLLLRVGASDTDEQLWLQERRQGLTATEIKQLVVGEIDDEMLCMSKFLQTGVEPNRYLAWGKVSEELVAHEVMRNDPLFQWEHRVFHASYHPQYLASPDMVREENGVLKLGEIKTSKKDLMNPSVFYRTGYFWQMQWQMYVCGAVSNLLIAQQHNDVWVDVEGADFPQPQKTYPLQYRWIDRDEAAIKQLVERAEQYFRFKYTFMERMGVDSL